MHELPPDVEPYFPVLMAARHALACAWLAGMERSGEARVPVDTHLAIRMEQIRACLALPR